MLTNSVSLRPILVVKKVYILSENRHLRFWHESCNSLLATPVSVKTILKGDMMNYRLTTNGDRYLLDWADDDVPDADGIPYEDAIYRDAYIITRMSVEARVALQAEGY